MQVPIEVQRGYQILCSCSNGQLYSAQRMLGPRPESSRKTSSEPLTQPGSNCPAPVTFFKKFTCKEFVPILYSTPRRSPLHTITLHHHFICVSSNFYVYKYFFVCAAVACLVPGKVRMRHDADFFLVGRQMERTLAR